MPHQKLMEQLKYVVGNWKLSRKLDFRQVKIFSFDFSPDGKTLASSHNQGTVANGSDNRNNKATQEASRRSRNCKVFQMAKKFSHLTQKKWPKIWFHHSLKEMLIVLLMKIRFQLLHFHQMEKQLLLLVKTGTTKLWNAKTGYHRKSIKGHPLPLTGRFSSRRKKNSYKFL